MIDYEQYLTSLGIDMWYLHTPTGGTLNPHLVARQQLSVARIDELKRLHGVKGEIFARMRESCDASELRGLAAEFDKLEFQMQKAWGFPENVHFHEWYNVPKCSCPKHDNEELRGLPQRIVSTACIIHADAAQETLAPVVI